MAGKRKSNLETTAYAIAILVLLVLGGPFIAGLAGFGTKPAVEFASGTLGLLVVLGIAVVVLSVFPLLGAYVAKQKGRSTTEGAVFGFLLGPFGVLIELMLPTIEAKRHGRQSRKA
ncbi:MAG: hypothetical protein P4L67_04635 [Candidatus Pacebacteria bacterium]|nr:hypothetical protein [Candidatus Paceibacterota bacterium]